MTKRMTRKKILKNVTDTKETFTEDNAISPVIGEILLIVLVVILIPSVTITLLHQLPQDRIPTVHIFMDTDGPGHVLLYHKGGDYININDIEILVQDMKVDNWKASYHKVVFDLGDVIEIPANRGDRISLVAKKAVIFRGVVPS